MTALVKHVVTEKPEFEITAYSKMERFLDDQGTYDVAVLTEPYLDAYEENRAEGLTVHHVMFLMSEQNSSRDGAESIVKFQSMSSFIAQILRTTGIPATPATAESIDNRRQVICVFSPIHHELQLPVALCVSAWCSKRQPTLFINMEELSIQSSWMNLEGRKDLLDLLYIMGNRKGKKLDLKEFICESEGVNFIPPMGSPSEVAYITGDQWMTCKNRLQEEFSGTIVFLVDHVMQGFEQLLSSCDGLILLSKPGEYYRRSTDVFQHAFMEGRRLQCWVHHMALPMSAGKSMDMDYDFGKLLRSKLGEQIRKELANVAFLPR